MPEFRVGQKVRIISPSRSHACGRVGIVHELSPNANPELPVWDHRDAHLPKEKRRTHGPDAWVLMADEFRYYAHPYQVEELGEAEFARLWAEQKASARPLIDWEARRRAASDRYELAEKPRRKS